MAIADLSERPYWSLTSLAGRGVIVNGAVDAVGYAVAERALEAGATVLLTDRNAGMLTAMQRALAGVGVAHVLQADASRASDVGRIIEHARTVLPNLYGIVHNLGPLSWSRAAVLSEPLWADLFQTALTSAMSCARAFGRAGDPLVGASIVLVADADPRPGVAGCPGLSERNVDEIKRFLDMLAIEFDNRNVRINAVASGAPARSSALAPVGSRRAPRRPGMADDMARIAMFYLSDLSSYVTGSTLSLGCVLPAA